MYRGQIERKRAQRVDAERKVAQFRGTEAAKRAAATKAQASAARSSSSTTINSYLREAQRNEDAANRAGRDAASWQQKATNYLKEESDLQKKLLRAEQDEAATRSRQKEQADRAAEVARKRQAAANAANTARLEGQVAQLSQQINELRAAKSEKLRVLLLAASGEGDLRVGREQKRIRAAVEAALHRDFIELDVRPSATTGDLLDGLTRFRPHVVHFSGHGDDDLVVLEEDDDAPRPGVIVSAHAFARALAAVDEPPIVTVLNSCNSAPQAGALTNDVIPFAIGMADEIDDGDAISFSAQFYAAVANGQSLQAAYDVAKAGLELAGLSGSELPTLFHRVDVDPGTTFLVRPPYQTAP